MKRKHLLTGTLWVAVLMFIVTNTGLVKQYLEEVSVLSRGATIYEEALPVFGQTEYDFMTEAARTPEEQLLWERIVEKSKQTRIEPIDAKVDRVWKAIPGYNGREINIEATFNAARQLPKDAEISYVYREIEPDVQLEQLGPHPIYRGNTNKPMVSFMINVAWGNEYIPQILTVLQQENVHATFFFDGSWLKQNIDVAKEIVAAGHEASNHGYSHKMMSKLNREAATQEIMRTEALLKDELGVHNVLYAPAAGDFNDATVQIAHELQLKTVLWTLDTVDWKVQDSASIVRKINSRLEPGSMILMHPTASGSGALQEMIRFAKAKGLAIGSVSELLSSQRVADVSWDETK